MLVKRTSPSGTIATVPATEPRIAPASEALARSWLIASRTAVGTIAHVTIRRIVSIPARNSERVSVNRRASSARRAA